MGGQGIRTPRERPVRFPPVIISRAGCGAVRCLPAKAVVKASDSWEALEWAVKYPGRP